MSVITRRLHLRGPFVEMMRSRDPELLLAGPAGTGKSTAGLWYIHLLCLTYPGIRVLLVRKTAVSLTNTTLVTYEQHVANNLIATGEVQWYGGSGHESAGYRYANSSRISTGGMDNPDRVLSSQYDVVFVDEVTELTESDWEILSTRLRNHVLPWQQAIGACNPQHPNHWAKRRADIGTMRMLESRHEDNPAYYDDDGNMTPEGKAYIATLDRLTGIRRERLRHGRWVSAEGVIYDTFDSTIHVIDPFPIPREWTRYWTIDFGTRNPFVWQSWAEDHDGELYLYREWYKTGELIGSHARTILGTVTRPGGPGEPERVWLEPRPRSIICDHDLQGRMILEDALGMGTAPAMKSVLEGIQAVSARFASRRLHVFSDAQMTRDPILIDSHRPTSFVEEIGGYVWDITAKVNGEDRPVKEDDHAMDCARYMVADRDLATQPSVRFM